MAFGVFTAAAVLLSAGCANEHDWRYLDNLDPFSVAYAGYSQPGRCRATEPDMWSDQAAELSAGADPQLLYAAQREAELECRRRDWATRERALAKRRHWRDTVGPSSLYSQLK